jgi:cobalt-zinc-cadmium efflux system protein
VAGVHDLHVWQMSTHHAALSAHVTIDSGESWLRILDAARHLLSARFHIHHVTLQPSWPLHSAFGDRRVIPIVPTEGE